MILTLYSVNDEKISSNIIDNIKKTIKQFNQYKDTLNGAKATLAGFNAFLKQQANGATNAGAALDVLKLKTIGLKAATVALNAAVSFGLGLLASLAVSAVTNFIDNFRSKTEKLTEAMEASHAELEQASSDVDDLEGKIEALNQQIKAAGAETISDIVDPQERERVQAINDALQQQLELNKQLEEQKRNRNHDDAVNNYNDKGEAIYVDSNGSYVDATNPDAVAHSATKTEALEYQATVLEDLTARYVEADLAYKELLVTEGADSKATEKALKEKNALYARMTIASDETARLAEENRAMQGSLRESSIEYQNITAGLTLATIALEVFNDTLSGSHTIDTSNFDVALQKIKAIKEEIDNGYSVPSDYRVTNAVSSLAQSGVTTGDDILSLSGAPTKRTEEQTFAIKILKEEAAKVKLSLEEYIRVLEEGGLVAIKAATETKKLSGAMTSLDNMQTAYQSCASAVKEYNSTGYVTMDTLQSLVQLEPKYLSMLESEDGKLKINTETTQALTDANIELARASLLADTIENIKNTDNLEKAKSVLADVKSVVEGATGQLLNAQSEAAQKAYEAEGIEGYDAVMRATAQMIENYKTLDALLIELGNRKPSEIWGDDTEAKELTDFASAWDVLTNAMKEYNQLGHLSASNIKALTGLEDAYTSCLIKNGNELEINAKQFRDIMVAQLSHEKEINGTTKKAEELTEIISWMDKNVKEATISYEVLNDIIKGYGTSVDEAREKTDGLKNAFSKWANIRDSFQGYNARFEGLLNHDQLNEQTELLRELEKVPGLVGEVFNPETGEIDLSGDALKTAVVTMLNHTATLARETGGEAAEAIADSYEKAANDIEKDVIGVEQYFNGLDAVLNKINGKLDGFQSNYNDLTDIVAEYNKYGALSQDSYQKILSLSPKFLACLELECNQLRLNKEEFKKLYVEELNAQIKEAESKESTKDLAKVLIYLRDHLDDVGDHMQGMGKQAEELASQLSSLKSIFDGLMKFTNEANEKQSNKLKIWGEAAIKKFDDQIEALNKQKEALNEQKDALKEANEQEERAITLAKLKAALEKAKTQRTVRIYTSNGYEWVADNSAIKDAQDDLSDQEREWAKQDAEKEIDDKIEAIDKQIDSINDLKKKWQEAMDLIGESWEDYKERLEAESTFQDMTLEEMEKGVEGYKDAILVNMEEIKNATDMSEAVENISSLIDIIRSLGQTISFVASIIGIFTSGGGIGSIIGLVANFLGFGGLIQTTSAPQKAKGDQHINKGGVYNVDEEGKELIIRNPTRGRLTNLEVGDAVVPADVTANLFKMGSNPEKWVNDHSDPETMAISGTDIINAESIFDRMVHQWMGIFTAWVATLLDMLTEGMNTIKSNWTSLFYGSDSMISIAKDAESVIRGDTNTFFNGEEGLAAIFKSAYGVITEGAKMMLETLTEVIKQTMEAFKELGGSIGGGGVPGRGSVGKVITTTGGVAAGAALGSVLGPAGMIVGGLLGGFFGSKLATGSKAVPQSQVYNVDEKGSELIVRKPAAGRYAYLETGDGVVPADITARLFEMGGNPDKWIHDQIDKIAGNSPVIVNHGQTSSINIGDIIIQKPVGDADELARVISTQLPNKILQMQSRR